MGNGAGMKRGMVFFLVREQERTKEKAEADELHSSGAKQGSFFRRKANITCRQANFTVKQLHSPKANITDFGGS